MRTARLGSFRVALLSTLGLVHACGGRTTFSSDTSRVTDASVGKDRHSTDESGKDAGSAGTTGASRDAAVPLDASLVETTSTPARRDGGAISTDWTGRDTTSGGDTASGDAGGNPTSTDTSGPGDAGLATDSDAGQVIPVAVQCSGAQRPLGDGLQQCESGLIHRVARPVCDSEVPRADVDYYPAVAPLFSDAGVAVEGERPELPLVFELNSDDVGVTYYSFACLQDADCEQRPYGYCETYSGWPSSQGSYCRYGCVTDDDCETNEVCECGSPIGQCRPANCSTDADCASDQACARYSFDDGCGQRAGYACTSPSDECTSVSDCGGDQCQFSPEGEHLECAPQTCVVGRPFLVQGCQRLAGVVTSRDWRVQPCSEGPASNLFEMATDTTRRAAHEWRQVGLMEHASIAAFARFALQLLSVGAPSNLVQAATRAMADETQHAKLAFSLAEQLDGLPLGPGPLDIERAFELEDLCEVVINTVLEGCIGETVAALEAAEALEVAEHPSARAALRLIERDERQHAELAWQFVAWALRQQPALSERVRSVVAGEQAKAEMQVDKHRAASRRTSLEGLHAYGVLSKKERVLLKAQVLSNVVVPCMAELCVAQTDDDGALSRVPAARPVKGCAQPGCA